MDPELPPRCAKTYRVESPISRGGFATVFLAHHLELGRPVALKLLRDERINDPATVTRFKREAKITASLNHPNVVRVLDHDVEDGLPWIAYEYLPGRTLNEPIRTGPPGWPEALGFAIQVAAGLEAAHASGILHRDVKTRNVIEAEPGHWKVADFGLATWSASSTVVTAAGTVMGTPHYLAPEIVKTGEYSVASDIYALGIVLFELLTGKYPFGGTTPAEIIHGHILKPVPAPSSVLDGVPPALDGLVLAALAKDPGSRYESMARFRRAMERAVEPEEAAPSAGPAGEARPSRTTRRTGRLAASQPAPPEDGPGWSTAYRALIAVCVLTPVLLAALLAWIHPRPRTPSATPSPMPMPTSQQRLDLASLVQHYEATRALRRAQKPTFSQLVESTLQLAADANEVVRDARKLVESSRRFAREFGSIVERLETSHPDPRRAPLPALYLLCQALAEQTVATLNLDRTSTLLETLAARPARGRRGSSPEIGPLGLDVVGNIRYGRASLLVLEHHLRRVGTALSAIGSRGEKLDERLAGTLEDIMWVASYTTHFRRDDPQTATTSESLAQALGAGRGAGGLSETIADAASDVWLLASRGAGAGSHTLAELVSRQLTLLGDRCPDGREAFRALAAKARSMYGAPAGRSSTAGPVPPKR